jgi:tetratricopeptide (TPR) repeat protein
MITPDNAEIQLEKAYAYYLLNRKPEAQEILENVLKNADISEETKIKINFNLGTYYLYQDRFQEGLRKFILDGAKMKLWNTETIFNRNEELDLPFWQGSPDVKHLIVYAEAGIGDEIINIRFMKHLKERGITPYWYAKWHGKATNDERKGLTQVFTNNGFTVINDLAEVSKIPGVQWTYSMHLPIYLDLQYEDLWDGPYLKADQTFVKKWSLKIYGYAWEQLTYYSGFKPLPDKLPKRLKIGIRWQGNPAYDHDLHRSYPIKQLYEAIGNKDYYYYSLQRDHGLEELKDFPGISDLSSELETIEDLFGAIANLDIIITSCTSIAHAAASMGKRVIVMTPISAYYVWSHSGDKSPWYGDNVTLLRQQRPRVWDEPIAQLKEILNG